MPERNGSNRENLDCLSTIGELDPLRILEKFGNSSVLLVAIAVETRPSSAGGLAEIGDWIKKTWNLTLERMPGVQGCRLLWDKVFFAFPGIDSDQVKSSFQRILKRTRDDVHLSRCVIHQADGDPRSKLLVLDDMEHDLWSERNFGGNANFTTRLVDGEEWPRRR